MADALADKRQAQQGIEAFSRDFGVDAQLEFGPDARHTKQGRRPRPAQIGEEGLQALGEKNGLPGIDRRHFYKHPLRHMAQRQIRQQPVTLPQAEQLSTARGSKPQGAETVHHPFRQAGSTGGVDNSCQAGGIRQRVVLDRRTGLHVHPTEIESPAGTQRQADSRHPRRNARRHRRPVIELTDQRQPRLRVGQHMRDGLSGKVGIKRHRHMPGHPDRQVGDDPVGAVF